MEQNLPRKKADKTGIAFFEEVPKGNGFTFNTSDSSGGGSTDTGSPLTTASISLNTVTFTKGDSSTFNITVDTGSQNLQDVLTEGNTATGDINLTGGIITSKSASIDDIRISSNGNQNNAGIGLAVFETSSGNNVTAFGAYALSNNTGDNSSAFGFQSLEQNSGPNSLGFGYQSLQFNEEEFAIGIGAGAGRNNKGFGAVGVGRQALRYNSGSNNTAIGYQSGVNGAAVQSGSNNTFLGALTRFQGTGKNLQNSTAVGYNTILYQDNTIVLGDTSNTSLKVAIGRNFSISAKLHIKGEGNTSATTTLIVEDSGGNDLLKVTDDGTVTINEILTLPGQHPLPTPSTAGTFAVSSSSPPRPYFWDGSSWLALV